MAQRATTREGGNAAADGPRDGDGALVAALVRGEPSAFERLVRFHGPRMLAAIRRIVRHDEDANDALQDAFVSVFKSVAGFSGDAGFPTWLHRVAVNAALMKLRSKRRRPETPIDDLLPKYQDDGHEIRENEPWSASAAELAAHAETRALVRRLVDELPESYRVTLVLRDLEELPTDEVARLLDTTPNAIKIRVHRARQALRTLLDQALRSGSIDAPRAPEGGR